MLPFCCSFVVLPQKIIKHHPFTIQLLYDSKANTQPIEICEDVGYNYIGISVKSQHTKKNGSVNVEFKTPSRGGKKSSSLKKLKIVKTSNLMHSAWTKVS